MLCRERLSRILSVLDRHAGRVSVRDFGRSYAVPKWELEHAAALGWVQVLSQKPATGRPSLIVCRVSKTDTAKLPPYRWEIPKSISIRHQRFAIFSTLWAVRRGSSFFGGLPTYTDAYLKAFPGAVKRRAAAASMSRLLRRTDVQAARRWYWATLDAAVPAGESMPLNAKAILARLRELGSPRAN